MRLYILYILLFFQLAVLGQSNNEWKPLPKIEGTPAVITKVKAEIERTPKAKFEGVLKEEYTDKKFEFYTKVLSEVIDSNFTFRKVALVPNRVKKAKQRFLFKDNSTSNIKYIDRVHGLFLSGISSISEDENGLIYLAGKDELAIYNGDEYEIYSQIDSFSFGGMDNMFLDSDNRMWISTVNGFAYIQNDYLYIPNSRYINSRNRVAQANDGGVFISTREQGLFKLKNTIFSAVLSNIAEKSVFTVLQTKDDDLWISFEDKRYFGRLRNDSLFIMSGGSITTCFFEDGENLWVSIFEGEFYIIRNDSVFDVTNSMTERRSYRSFSMAKNENGLWICRYGGGVTHINNENEVTYYDPSSGFSNRNTYSLLIDRENNIWVADLSDGVSRIESNILSLDVARDDIYAVVMIAENEDKEKLYFKNGAKLTLETADEFIRFSNPPIGDIPSVRHSNDGYFYKDEIWTANYGGALTLIKDGEYTFYQVGKKDYFNNQIFDIQRDKSGRVWMHSAEKNLFCFYNDTYFNYSNSEEFKGLKFFLLAKMESEKIVAYARNKGFILINESSYKHYSTNTSLMSNQVSCVYEDSVSNLWVFQPDVMQIIDENENSKIIKDDVLVGNHVKQVVKIKTNQFLLVSTNGIIKLTFKNGKPSFQLFNENYGQFFLGVTHILKTSEDGILVTSTRKVFNLKLSYLNDPVSPKLLLKRVEINNHVATDSLTLDQESSITLKFDKILWANESVLKYRLTKNNKEGSWKEEHSSKIMLSELIHGNYIMEVYAASKGLKSEKLSYEFKVIPYWYQTNWALFLLILILILIFLAFTYYRSVKAKRTEKKLQVMVTEKTNELRSEKEEVSKQLSQKELLLKEVNHRVKNNMQMISSLMELQSASVDDEKSRKAIQEGIERIKALGFAHQDLYQNEDYNHIFIKEYLNKIAQNLCLHTQISVSIDVPNNYLMHIEKAQSLGFIVNELITNSIKYAWSVNVLVKEIKIELKVVDGNVSFIYTDNGGGYPENYDFKKSGSLGTKLINSFVERQLMGTIKVLNKNGAVTHIKFKQENVD